MTNTISTCEKWHLAIGTFWLWLSFQDLTCLIWNDSNHPLYLVEPLISRTKNRTSNPIRLGEWPCRNCWVLLLILYKFHSKRLSNPNLWQGFITSLVRVAIVSVFSAVNYSGCSKLHIGFHYWGLVRFSGRSTGGSLLTGPLCIGYTCFQKNQICVGPGV